MRFILSAEQIPEVADLSEQQRLMALRMYKQHRRATESVSLSRINFAEVGLVGSIVLAEIAGFVGGWFYWRGIWGSMAGAILAMWLVMAIYYVVDLCINLPKIRRFFRSDIGRHVIDEIRKTDFDA